MAENLPPTPTRQIEGQTVLATEEKLSDRHNVENLELYAVFPFRLYGADKEGLEMARLTV